MSGIRKPLFVISILLLSVFACDTEPEKTIFAGPQFVFFESEFNVPVLENVSAPLTIPLKVSLAQKQNVSVTFEVIGEGAVPDSDYKVISTSPLQITAGLYSTEINIRIINNEVRQKEKRIIRLRITSVTPEELTAQVTKEILIEIQDDDCANDVPQASNWIGDLSIRDGSSTTSGKGTAGAGGICGGSIVVDGNFFGSNNPTSKMTINLIQKVLGSENGIANVIRFKLFSGTDRYEYEASGTYTEAGQTITLNYTLYDTQDAANNFNGTHIITP
jgi:hypothetical protein